MSTESLEQVDNCGARGCVGCGGCESPIRGDLSEEDNSRLVQQNIQWISKMFEVNLERLDEQDMILFREIEKIKREKVNGAGQNLQIRAHRG